MKHAISRIVAVSVLTAAVCNATDVSGVWTAAGHPSELVDGVVVIEYDDADNVTALTVAPENGGTVSLSGDAIPFADGAEIRMASAGRLVISNELSGSGMVVLTNADAAVRIEYDGSLLYTNQWTTMFHGRQLSDYMPTESIRREEQGVYDPGIYYPYNVRRYDDGGMQYMSIQLMASQPTTTRAILMRLRQNGDDIEGIIDRVCYYSGRFIHGEDIEKLIVRHAVSPETGFEPHYYVHTPVFDHGYGVSNLFMEKTTVPEIVFSGTASASLEIAVASGIKAQATQGGLMAGDVTTPFRLAGGTFVVNGRTKGADNFYSTVNGHGVLSLAESDTGNDDTNVDSYADFIKSTVNVSINRRLATLTNVTASLSGSYFSATRTPAVFYRYPGGNGLCITGELQVASNETTLRFVVLAIEQYSRNIRATAVKSGYVRIANKNGVNATTVVGKYSAYDENIPNRGTAWNPNFADNLAIATSDTVSAIGACDFRFFYSEPAGKMFNAGGHFYDCMKPAEIARDTQNVYESIKLSIAGTPSQRMLVRIPTEYAYPTNGIVEVGAYGELDSERQGSNGKKTISDDTALIRVLTNGIFRTNADFTLGSFQHVHLVGGRLLSREDLANTTTDSSCYYNLLTFRDGAVASGAPMRVGFAGAASWRVAGAIPSTCEANLLLSSLNNNTYKTAEFNVTDVTDDDGIDFHLRGNVDALDNTHSNIVLRKTGGGTLAQHGTFASRLAPAPVKIEAGTWLLCGTASPNQAYNLAGGTLATEADSDNSVGGLVVSDSGAIKVAAAASLAFADSAAITWTGAGTVQVDADLTADAVRFGSSADALTSQQLKRLRHGELKVKLDADGYLRDRIDGTHIIIR